MRRLGLVVTAVCGVVAVATGGIAVAAPAVAKAPTPAPSTGTAGAVAGAGQPLCTVSDSRLTELSGLVAVENGYLTINDSHPEASAKRIYRVDGQCKVVSSIAYPTEARDPEDIAMGPDGTAWVADIGDNDAQRTTVGFWKLAPGAKSPVVHRVTYPDGARDAEAILIAGDGNPVIITKELGRPAGIYVPSAALVPNSQTGVPLKRVGEFSPPSSETPNGIGPPGRLVITGGATAPDGKRVTLRTYADAFEWDVPDGDVVKAITTGKPRVTPLPDEPQGEAITYSRDGRSFVTVSDLSEGKPAPLLRYVPAAAPTSGGKRSAGAGDSGSAGALSNLSLNDITLLIAAVGVLGLILVVVGVVAIRHSRRARGRGTRRTGTDGPGAGGPGAGGPGAGGPGAGGPGARGRTGFVGGAGHAAAAEPAVGRRNSYEDEPGALPPPARRNERGAVYGGGARGAYADGEHGLVDAASPSRRGSPPVPPPPPPESPVPGADYGGFGGRAGGRDAGPVYRGREAPVEPPDWAGERDPYGDQQPR